MDNNKFIYIFCPKESCDITNLPVFFLIAGTDEECKKMVVAKSDSGLLQSLYEDEYEIRAKFPVANADSKILWGNP